MILIRSWLKIKSEAMPWQIPPAKHGLSLAMLTNVSVRLTFANMLPKYLGSGTIASEQHPGVEPMETLGRSSEFTEPSA